MGEISHQQKRLCELVRVCVCQGFLRGNFEASLLQKREVIVAGVTLSRDRKFANIYVRSLHGGSPKVLLAVLKEEGFRLQKYLAHALRMKCFVPKLRFLYDDTIEHAWRIDALLKEKAFPMKEPSVNPLCDGTNQVR